jgi:hypothetical protein
MPNVTRSQMKTSAIANDLDEKQDEAEAHQNRKQKMVGKVAGNWSRDRSNYSDIRGTPTHHCGVDMWWTEGGCKFYREENKCTKVSGYIAHRGVCDWWKDDGK